VYKTCIPLRKDEVDRAIEVCEDIMMKDESFRYKLYNDSVISGYDSVLVIYSDEKKAAYGRGYWFTEKVVGDYFWVKK